MDIAIVKFIQRASNDFLDGLFSILTTLGETTIFFMVFYAFIIISQKIERVKE